MKVLTI